MSDTINYTNAPEDIEEALNSAVILADDFLPSPDRLVRRTEKEKITIAIDKQSLDLYKKYAKKHNAKYQPMIDRVLSVYAEKFLKQY